MFQFFRTNWRNVIIGIFAILLITLLLLIPAIRLIGEKAKEKESSQQTTVAQTEEIPESVVEAEKEKANSELLGY